MHSSPRSRRTATRASPCCNSTIRGFYVLLSSPAQGLLQASFSAGAAGHRAEFDHHVARLSRYVHGGTSRQRSDVRRHGGERASLHHPARRLRPAKRLKRAHQPILGPRRPREHQPRHGHRLYDRGRRERAVCRHSVRVSRAGALPHHRQSDTRGAGRAVPAHRRLLLHFQLAFLHLHRHAAQHRKSALRHDRLRDLDALQHVRQLCADLRQARSARAGHHGCGGSDASVPRGGVRRRVLLRVPLPHDAAHEARHPPPRHGHAA